MFFHKFAIMKVNKNKPEWAPEGDNPAYASYVMPPKTNITSSAFSSPKSTKINTLTLDEYIQGIISDNRTILSKAITLVESNAPAHIDIAQEIITRILPLTGKSLRIGISGSPGVGKSTFIDVFGEFLINLGHKVAVLAIDPSSTRSRGSILGDKTRMENLSRNPKSFIRPSPSGGTLGGVARKTRETMFLCEAAGFDIILIETVGVGQSEVSVRSMVDYFLVLLLPGAGDDLQGIKKGIIELADGLAINKSEGEWLERARSTKVAYQNALHLLNHRIPDYTPPVINISAVQKLGIQEVWDEISKFIQMTKLNGLFEKNRNEQTIEWFQALLNEAIFSKLFSDPKNKIIINEAKTKVMNFEISPLLAVRSIVAKIFD